MYFLKLLKQTKPILGRWNTGKSTKTCMQMADMANNDYSLCSKQKQKVLKGKAGKKSDYNFFQNIVALL